jgi:osmoprotectant transport system permease protein
VNTLITDIGDFLSNPKYHRGYDSISLRLIQHCELSIIALLIAAAIALPLGSLTGHSGRGGGLVSVVTTFARAIPTYGLLVLLAVEFGIGNADVLIPLAALAVPPILLNTHEGIRGVDPAIVDAARGMGMHPRQVLGLVELPAALPLILSGLRSAAVQIVATATIAAAIGSGGLGRYIFDGRAQFDYSQVAGGAFLVSLLAVATLAVFALIGRFAVSPGLRRR